MAITSVAYATFLDSLGRANINFTSDNFWVALFTSSYSPPTFGYFDVRGDVEIPNSSNDLNSSADYSWNGQQLTNVAWNWSDSSQAQMLTADNVTWSALTGTFRYAIIYKWVPQSIDTIVVGHIDYGTDQICNNEPFTVNLSKGVVALSLGIVTS